MPRTIPAWQPYWIIFCALIGASILISGSIFFVGRYQIATIGYGYASTTDSPGGDTETVYRLDRWTGEIDRCVEKAGLDPKQSITRIECPARLP